MADSPAAETAERTAAIKELRDVAEQIGPVYFALEKHSKPAWRDMMKRLTRAIDRAELLLTSTSPAPEGEYRRGTAPNPPIKWGGQFFQPCDRCITRTHCASQHRCLTECVPASPEPALREQIEAVAQEFVTYWERNGGCGNCGGQPHTRTCFVGRFKALLSAAPAQGTTKEQP